jgi:hypothetical protein
MSHDNSIATATPSTTRWWWKKSSSTATSKKIEPSIKSSVVSSVNGADEDASILSLYSYGESLYSPSSVRNVSIRAQHTKSEYSGQFSDVESNASILSKPWVSRNVISPESDNASKHDEEEEEEGKSFISESCSTPQVNPATSSTDILDSSFVSSTSKSVSSPQPRTKRRGSFVDYITKKPLHGKLKVSFI